MIRCLLAFLALLTAIPAAAQQPTVASTFLEGSWGLRLDGSVIMRFDLELTEDGWTGRWAKPSSFASDGTRFGNIKMPAVERRADSGRAIGDWAEITFDDPRPGEEPDQFRIRLTGPDRAEMIYVGTGLPPFTLERVAPGAILGPFEDGRAYGPRNPRAAAAAAPAPGSAPAAAVPARDGEAPAAPTVTPLPLPPARGPLPPPPAEEPVQGPVDRPPAMIGR